MSGDGETVKRHRLNWYSKPLNSKLVYDKKKDIMAAWMLIIVLIKGNGSGMPFCSAIFPINLHAYSCVRY